MGRTPGSIRPADRMELATALSLRVDEIMDEGVSRRKAVKQALLEFYGVDHPDRSPFVVGPQGYVTEHFFNYCRAKAQLCKTVMREFREFEQALERGAPVDATYWEFFREAYE